MKLDHIQLAIPEGEENKARDFFVEILGMDEEEKPFPLVARGGCWFRKGSVIIHLGVEKDFLPQKKAQPAFLVSDLNALEAKLITNGFPVFRDTTLPNRTRFYTTDPFENRMEFMKYGEGFSQQ